MKGAANAQTELLKLIAAVQGCCFELAQLAATTPQATARSRTAMHPDGFLGVVNDVAAAGVDLAEVVFRPGDGLVGLGQGSDHLAQEDSTLCASSWRSSQYGIAPRLDAATRNQDAALSPFICHINSGSGPAETQRGQPSRGRRSDAPG